MTAEKDPRIEAVQRWSWKRIICVFRGCRFDGWAKAGAQPGKPLPMAYCGRCGWEL